MFVEAAKMIKESKQSKTVEVIEKPLFTQEDDKASREYSSKKKEIVSIIVSSKKEASTLSGETLKSPQY